MTKLIERRACVLHLLIICIFTRFLFSSKPYMQLKNDAFEKLSDLDSKLYIKSPVRNETHKDSSIPDSDHHHESSTVSNEILNSLISPVQNETRKDSSITDSNHHQESSTDINETPPQGILMKPSNETTSFAAEWSNPNITVHEFKSSKGITDATEIFTETSEDVQCVRKHIHATSSQILQTKEERRRQILYIHPGPPKTATTTIQRLLTTHEDHLRRDNIFYLGKKTPRKKNNTYNCKFPMMPFCIIYKQYSERAEGKNLTCVHSMKDQLNAYYRMGKDVIVSDEVIGAMFTGKKTRVKKGLRDLFSEVLKTNDWEIRVLIGYRPYFDFLRSSYHERYKARGKPNLSKWPGQGGIAIPSLHQTVLQDSQNGSFSDKLVEVFQPYADRVDVFDITANADVGRGDLSERFFCDLLEDAHEACSFSRDNSEKEVRQNVAASLDFDRIVTAAADQGLVNKTAITREDVRRQAREFWKYHTSRTPGAQLPLVCPSQNQTTILYAESSQQEILLFPERKPNWETRPLFDAMMREQRLCSVDLERVLQTEEWKKFFRLVKPKRRRRRNKR